MSMGNKSNAPPSKGGPTPSTNPQTPNPYGGQFQPPERYSNDYFRYQQSGDPFNQPVMGYGTYGQIFTPPPQRFQPQPIMGGKGGGMGYRPPPPIMGGKGGGMGYRPPPPPTMGGKGGQQPQQPFMSYPGGSGYGNQRRRPERRTLQLGLNNEIGRKQSDVPPTVTPPEIIGVNQAYPAPEYLSRTGGPGAFPPDDMGVSTQALIPATQDGVSGYYTDGSQRNFVPYRNQPVAATNGIGVGEGSPVRPIMFDNEAFQNFRFGDGFGQLRFQEGGQVPPDAATNMEQMLSEAGPANPQAEMSGEYDRLIQMTMQAVLGQVEQPDEIIQMFIEEFGVDAFRQLRDAVLKQQVPNAQTEGMVDGNGGGMDDQVMGMIGSQRPVAVSPGEYIIPADVVSGLGDGSSKSGADILDELSQAVRMARTGTSEQPRPLMETLSQ